MLKPPTTPIEPKVQFNRDQASHIGVRRRGQEKEGNSSIHHRWMSCRPGRGLRYVRVGLPLIYGFGVFLLLASELRYCIKAKVRVN